MWHIILWIPGNIEDSLGIPSRKFTEDISDFLSLLSAASHSGVNKYGIHDAKENGYDDVSMADINDYGSVSFS